MTEAHCSNPRCDNWVYARAKKSNTTNGIQEYCSRVCWAQFTPAMRKVCNDLGRSENATELYQLILDLQYVCGGTKAVAARMGVSRSTLRGWMGKLTPL